MSQLTLDFGPPPPPTLDNFVAGRNGECLAALRALLHRLREGLPLTNRFIYVWGPTSTGKSHLAAALRGQTCPDLTVVDDCHLLSAEGQERLFHRFDAMMQSPSLALVAFGDEPPGRLRLMPELTSRFGWGIVFALEPLDDTDLQAAVERAANERGLSITGDVADYLMHHAPRHLAGLKALLDGLDRLSLASKRPITVSMLRNLMENGGEENALRENDGDKERTATGGSV